MKQNLNQKKLILIIALSAILMMPGVIYAKADSSLTKEQRIAATKVRLETKIAKINKKQLKVWQKLARKKIHQNINRLNQLARIANSQQNLTVDQRNSITNDINTDIDKLNNLKIKINQNVDLAEIKTDIKSIMSVESINAKYLSKINAAI